jgi:hypothetical protein
MASLTTDRNTLSHISSKQGRKTPFAKAAETYLKGCIVCLDGTGLGVDGVAGSNACGISQEHKTGVAGDRIETYTGVFGLDYTGTITGADVGKIVYVVDNHTVALTGTGVAGRITGLGHADTKDAGQVHVHIDAALFAAEGA